MSYSQFETLEATIEQFGLRLQERCFFPELPLVQPSDVLRAYLKRGLPVVSSGSEKARSEGIIYPVLLEVRELLEEKISLFSGKDFSIDATVGLNGIVDFMLCRSPNVLALAAPAVVVVEAKKVDISGGYGQCVAEMVAMQRFNAAKGAPIEAVYGSVSTGTQWRFLQLVEQDVTIDLQDYPLPPVEGILAKLLWMMR
jgi:hypothetical protein